MYKMMIAVTNPTPKPATRRPTTRRAMVELATWRMTPMMKMPQPVMTVPLRPIQLFVVLARDDLRAGNVQLTLRHHQQ